jgi:hypothetical protein
MTRTKSQELRKKNNCSTCERRGNFPIGCQVFVEELENCWAHTTDKRWLIKAENEIKRYAMMKKLEEDRHDRA